MENQNLRDVYNLLKIKPHKEEQRWDPCATRVSSPVSGTYCSTAPAHFGVFRERVYSEKSTGDLGMEK